jgi:probable addiction module antidote protein
MLKTKKFDIVDYLKTEKDREDYLNAALEEKDFTFLPVALADIARAREAVSCTAKADGVPQTALCHSLSAGGRAAFETVANIADSLGYKITLVPKSLRSTSKKRSPDHNP